MVKKNDGQYETISKGPYYYDKNNPEIGQFQVLAVEDNTVNGMQASVFLFSKWLL
ncbi:hypothetical protein [Streptococcus sp. A22]|uniref:hypothetical protein n=1 Tax=Streptococcus sp. A22 TaxID=3373126 RepID=UPI001432762C|nr:hypothetical protein [Streptococcus suis]HEM6266336.1 hypothetical protein [Streptococcus suis]